MNDDLNWMVENYNSNNVRGNKASLSQVFMHEIGHSLGLDHSKLVQITV